MEEIKVLLAAAATAVALVLLLCWVGGKLVASPKRLLVFAGSLLALAIYLAFGMHFNFGLAGGVFGGTLVSLFTVGNHLLFKALRQICTPPAQA